MKFYKAIFKAVSKVISKAKIVDYILFILHSFVLVYFLKLSYDVVSTIRPMPTSDFIYYWNLASDLSIYHKGGIIGFIYAPFKYFGIQPYWSALVVNSTFLILVFTTTWLGVKQKNIWYKLGGQLFATFGFAMFALWNTGYAGMVNADFPNVALLIASTRFFSLYLTSQLSKNSDQPQSKLWLILSGIAIFLAVALRVKTGLALGIIVGFTILFNIKKLTKDSVLRAVILTVCIAVFFAAISELALRSQSDRPLDVARQGRLQLYTGLLDTEVGSMCGRWTREAYDKTLEEIDLPLVDVISKHLSVKSKSYILDIIFCKLEAVINYDEFSFRETLAFGVKYRDYTVSDLEITRHYEKVEEGWVKTFKWITSLLILACIMFRIRYKIRGAFIPFTIYLAFMMLHSIFEIQARYMAEPLLWSFFAAVLILFEIPLKQEQTIENE
jgi:hypothetical protein